MSEHAIREYLKTIGNGGGGTSQETDPVFTASPASGISAQDIADWNDKQDELVSGTNIKTINGTSLLGSGDIQVAPSVTSTDVPTADTISEFDSDAHMNSTDMTTGADSELEDFIDGLNVSGGDRTSSTLTVSSGWTASQNWCKRSAYTVEFYIEVTGGTLASGWNTIATLPQDYIPPSCYDFVAVENTNDTSVHGKVTATGAVQVYKASNVTNALRIHSTHMVF